MQQASILLIKSSSGDKPSLVKMVIAMSLVFVTSLLCKVASGLAALRFWYQLSQTRMHLARLEDWQLKDVGLTQEQAMQEAAKYFWQN